MIEGISISGVATYPYPPNEPSQLTNLAKVNFIFGSNGSGKSTIGRIISQDNPALSWLDSTPLESFVYNTDFIEENFSSSEAMNGVFTLGEGEINIRTQISDLTAAKNELARKRSADIATRDAKQSEIETHVQTLITHCWGSTARQNPLFKEASKGLLNSKRKFMERVLYEKQHNQAPLLELSELTELAKKLFGEQLNHIDEYTPLEAGLQDLESDPIFSTQIVGSTDTQVAALISQLENSDWVKQGLSYFEKTRHEQCPFCQQQTPQNLSTDLFAYFDDAFEQGLKRIESVLSSYSDIASELVIRLRYLASDNREFIDKDQLSSAVSLLEKIIESNTNKIHQKLRTPSEAITLESTTNAIGKIGQILATANGSIRSHNHLAENFRQERAALIEKIWRYTVEVELKGAVDSFTNATQGLYKAVEALSSKVEKLEGEIESHKSNISQLEKDTTSVVPTMNAINKTLREFGFTGFSLAPTDDDKSYQLVRPDNSPALKTLSEGERSFITFLYFFHLVQGSLTSQGVTTNRVVVFDDPVTSMDSQVLYIVSSLIKSLFEDTKAGVGNIKQIFILTHNVYFHKEITFSTKSQETAGAVSYWTVQKTANTSRLKRFDQNPIKTSYELLWRELKGAEHHCLSIQNIMRRILETYFKVFGGIDLDKLSDKFTGTEKLICRSLVSWVNDGSHFVADDLYIENSEETTAKYLDVFRRIFHEHHHGAHYDMMMTGVEPG